MGISNTTKIIKKGVSVVAAGAIALGGVAAVPAFAVDPASADATNETLSVNDPTYIKDPTYIEFDDEVSDRLVPATQTPTTPDQAQKNLDEAKDNAKKVLETELGGGADEKGEGGGQETGTDSDNGPRVTRGATDTNNGIVNTGQNSVENGTSAGATDAKTAISNEAANAIAGAAKAQANADAVENVDAGYINRGIYGYIVVPNSNIRYIAGFEVHASPDSSIELDPAFTDVDGVGTHNPSILMDDNYVTVVKNNSSNISLILTYNTAFNDYAGNSTCDFRIGGLSEYAGKTVWVFVSYQNGTIFKTSPAVVGSDGIVHCGSIPAETGTYSIVIGEPPAQTTDPVDPTPTDPVDPNPTPTTPTDPEPTNPPQEDVVIPDDNTGKDEPTQKPDTDVNQGDKTPVLDTGSDEKTDAGDKQMTKSDTQNEDKKTSTTGTLPQTGDENGMLAAGLGLTAGASALLAAIGARRLRKERE